MTGVMIGQGGDEHSEQDYDGFHFRFWNSTRPIDSKLSNVPCVVFKTKTDPFRLRARFI
jgi:hypothetical protein